MAQSHTQLLCAIRTFITSQRLFFARTLPEAAAPLQQRDRNGYGNLRGSLWTAAPWKALLSDEGNVSQRLSLRHLSKLVVFHDKIKF
jgi:hypothetical protein